MITEVVSAILSVWVCCQCPSEGLDPFTAEASNPDRSKPDVLASVDFSPDGKQMLIAFWSQIVLAEMDGKKITHIYTVPGNYRTIDCAMFAGSGYAFLQDDHTLQLLDRAGNTVWRMSDTAAIAVSANGKRMATIGPNRTISVYELAFPRPCRLESIFLLHEPTESSGWKKLFFVPMIRFFPSDESLAGCVYGISSFSVSRPEFFVAQRENGGQAKWYSGRIHSQIQLNFPYVVLLHGNDKTRIHDVRTGQQVMSYCRGMDAPLYSAWVSSRGDKMMLIYSREVLVVDPRNGDTLSRLPLPGRASHAFPFAFSGMCNRIAIGTLDGNVLLIDCAECRIVGTIQTWALLHRGNERYPR